MPPHRARCHLSSRLRTPLRALLRFGLRFRNCDLGCAVGGFGMRVRFHEFTVRALWCRGSGLGCRFRILGVGFRVQGAGFRV